MNTSGIGSKTFNIGANGAAFGVSNNSSMTLSQMLAYTNSKSKNGLLYNGTSSLITSANSAYSEVNQIGDI